MTAGGIMQFQFENHTLDASRRELRRGAELVPVEPQVFDLLVYLVQNRDRVVTKDDLIATVWKGRIVSDSTLTSRINAVRKAVADSGDEQRLIRTIPRKGLRFVGQVNESVQRGGDVTAGSAARLQQRIRFCTASDGVRIAYADVGQGPPLVKTANWLNHLEYDWQSPIWSHLLHAFAAKHRLIRYDARGNGLSDWEAEDISLEAFMRDLESVVDAVGLDRFPLFGVSGGCAVAVTYAVRHPERVTHLVLYGGFARGVRKRGSREQVEQSDALNTLMLQGWGQENPAFRQIWTSQFIPGGTPEQMQWFNDLQRITARPENALRIRRIGEEVEAEHLLPEIRIPTLVMHCRGDARVPFAEGRRLAAGIKGARFVALEGRNHLILESEPAWTRFRDEIDGFLAT